MKSIMNGQQLDAKIAKAQKLHKKLVEILEKQKSIPQNPQGQPSTQSKPKPKHKSNPSEQKIKQNIEDRIKIYQHEIDKLSHINYESYLGEIRKLEEQIREVEGKSALADKEIRQLEEGLKRGKKDNDKASLLAQYSQAEKLRRKLISMETLTPINRTQGEHSKPFTNSTLRKRKAKSVTKILSQQPEEQEKDKRRNIDKEALYRNLIKYYEGQETKLKEEIAQLEKRKEEEKVKREEVEREIRETEEKIGKEKERLKMKN